MTDLSLLVNRENSTREHTSDEEKDRKENKDENEEEEETIEHLAKYHWYNVNLSMVPAKCAYFIESARRIGFTPTIPLFLTSIGLNKAEAGFIVGFRLLGMMIGGPLFGIVADKTLKHRLIIFLLCIFSVIFTCSQPFLSVPLADPILNTCPPGRHINMATTTDNNTGIINDINSDIQSGSRNSKLLIVMFVVNLLACFFEGSPISFIDTAVVRKCQLSRHRKVEYGKQRAIGALGAAAGIFVANGFVDLFPTADISCYSGIFISYFVSTILYYCSIVFVYRGISFNDRNSAIETQREDKIKIKKVLFDTFKQFDVIFFYICTFISGILYAQYSSFTLIYLKGLNAPSTLLSLTIAIASSSGIISFYFSATIIRIVGGTWQTLCLAFSCYFIRFLITSLILNPWLILVAQPLHSVTAALTVATGIHHVKTISPNSILTTMCSTFSALHYGVGSIVGSSIGGIVYERFGGRVLFLSNAILALVWSVLILMFIFIKKKKDKITKKNNNKDNIEEETELQLKVDNIF